MPEALNDFISKMFGKKWVLFFLVALAIFLVRGIWIFSTPKYETMYNHYTLPRVTTEKVFMDCHIFEIGNTGRKTQDKVDVLFVTQAFESAALPPKAEDFGMSTRRTKIEKSGDTTVMRLESLEPGKRVEIKLLLIYQKDETPGTRDDIFKGIETAEGEIVEGDPGWTTVARMLYAIFG